MARLEMLLGEEASQLAAPKGDHLANFPELALYAKQTEDHNREAERCRSPPHLSSRENAGPGREEPAGPIAPRMAGRDRQRRSLRISASSVLTRPCGCPPPAGHDGDVLQTLSLRPL